MQRSLILCLVAALASSQAISKPNTDWVGLQHSTDASIGSEIEVRTAEGKSYRGQLKVVDDDAVAMTTTNGEERLPRVAITQVSVRKHNSRWKHALIGAGAGAAVGLAVGAIADSHCRGFCFGLDKAFGAGIGLLGGAGAGAALPAAGWRVIYRKR